MKGPKVDIVQNPNVNVGDVCKTQCHTIENVFQTYQGERTPPYGRISTQLDLFNHVQLRSMSLLILAKQVIKLLFSQRTFKSFDSHSTFLDSLHL